MPKSKLPNTLHAPVSSGVLTKSARVSCRAVASISPTLAPPAAVTSKVPPTPASPASPATPLGKQAQVLALLRRPAGATIAEMMAVTGWMSHSVRGLLSAGIKRKLGLVVTSAVEPDRGRVYRVAPPAPMKPPPASPQDGAAAGPAKMPPTAAAATVRPKRSVHGSAARGIVSAAG